MKICYKCRYFVRPYSGEWGGSGNFCKVTDYKFSKVGGISLTTGKDTYVNDDDMIIRALEKVCDKKEIQYDDPGSDVFECKLNSNMDCEFFKYRTIGNFVEDYFMIGLVLLIGIIFIGLCYKFT